ncbi:MAG: hypothetical protein CL402_03840 [Acidiferrobacteraceae bacterium]|mgnify:FL=1|nr:hypothetical protein [Acidiferrobacteraceae bacterium]
MKRQRQTVCVQGLGFVGAAMAVAVSLSRDNSGNCRYDVIGVELPTEEGFRRVESINEGQFPLPTIDQSLVLATRNSVAEGNLSATTDQSVYEKAEVVIIDVALDIPIGIDSREINFSVLEEAAKTVGRSVRPGTLVIIETTVAPGTCEKIIIPILAKECKKRNLPEDSILVAHSYERVMPGNKYLDSIINFWRVFAGYTGDAAYSCRQFLETIINTKNFPLTELSSLASSETAKIMENSYRAANIAFIDEWTKFAEAIGIDLFEIIRAISIRPTHSNIRYPGVGVGGYCLTKDPLFAPAAASQIFNLSGLSFPFIDLTQKINQRMPYHVVDRLDQMFDMSLSRKRILIFGVSYRSDIGDSRYTPTETLVRELETRDAVVLLNDPLVEFWDEMERPVPSQLPDQSVDGVILAVAHTSYKQAQIFDWILNHSDVIVDAVDFFTAKEICLFETKGLRVCSIGRGGVKNHE